MTIKALKKLQLITVLLFIFSILIMTIGLTLIGSCDYHSHIYNLLTKKHINLEKNGFEILSTTSIIHILGCSPKFVCSITNCNGNYYNWIQLQIGVIFCLILVPILIIIILSLTFFIIGLKVKIKNNNFWDAIQNCEIISNYYIH